MVDFHEDPLGQPQVSNLQQLIESPRKLVGEPPIHVEAGPNGESIIRFDRTGRIGEVVEILRIDGEDGEDQDPHDAGDDDEQCWWNAHSVKRGTEGAECPPPYVSFSSPPEFVEQDEGKVWLNRCLTQDCKPKGGDLYIAVYLGRESACGLHAWLATECICCGGELRQEIPPPCVCLDKFDICRVKVEFRGVMGALWGDGNGLLHITDNRPWPCGPNCLDPPVQPCCEDPPGDCSEWVCSDSQCREWNQEWELFYMPEASGGASFCVFAEGQAKDSDDTSDGYQQTKEVYEVPEAGKTCFPCALVNEDTGMTMSITCLTDCLLSIDLDITINGCQFAVVHWNQFDPSLAGILNGKRSEQADEFVPNLNYEGCEQPCYAPDGACNDPLAAFPCQAGFPTGIAWIYDYHNCRWTQVEDEDDLPIVHFYKCGVEPPYDNPTLCNPCPPVGADDVQLATSDWTVVVASPGTATLIADVDARDNDAWSLCAGKQVSVEWTMPLLVESPKCRICLYIRYRQTDPGDDGLTSTGSVKVDSIDGVDPVFELYDLDEHLTYDDPRIDEQIDGYWYRFLGCFWVESEQTLEFTVEGATSPTDCLVFDDLVIRFS